MNLLSVAFVQPVAALLIPGKLFWPYFAAAVVLIVGLVRLVRSEVLQAHGIDRAVVFGSLFFAIPMAVFGADHFIAPKFVATLVPSWIPGHLFWVYLVGVALIASALSIATKVHSVLASTLLSAMLFSFVLLISAPKLAANPGDRFALAVLLRDLSFSGGALAYALAQAHGWPRRHVDRIMIRVRYIIAVAAVVFGVEHFLHPEFVPVVPLKQVTPPWIPAHLFLSYVTGAVLIACGLSMIINWRAHLAATWLGVFVFAIVLFVYLPIMVANLSDIANGLNYFADTLAFSGAALLLAGALPSEVHAEVSVVNRGETAARVGVSQHADGRTAGNL